MIDFNTILNELFKKAVEEATKPLVERVEKLEEQLTSDKQAIDDAVQEKLDQHLRDYDHDEFLTTLEDNDELRDEVTRLLRQADFSVEVHI